MSSEQQQRLATSSRPARPPQPSTSAHHPSSDIQECVVSSKTRLLYDEAQKSVEYALDLDEKGDRNTALDYYKLSLMKLESISASPLATEDNDIRNKTMKTQVYVRERITILENIANNRLSQSREDSPQPLPDSILHDSSPTDTRAIQLDANATLTYNIETDVRTYYIDNTGLVSAPSSEHGLQVYKFNEETEDGGSPAFMVAGDFVTPLAANSSPVLQSDSSTYIFPDVASGRLGDAVAVVLGNTVSQSLRQEFDRLINEFTAVKHNEDNAVELAEEDKREDHVPGESNLSHRLSKGLITGAGMVSRGLERGARSGGEWIAKGAVKLRGNMDPRAEALQVAPEVETGARYARNASHVAVKVTKGAVHLVGSLTAGLASMATPYIMDKMNNKMSSNSSASEKAKDVCLVAKSGLQSFGIVFEGLEAAAKSLGNALSTATVDTVNYKYGYKASKVADDSLSAVGNFGLTAYYLDNLTIKGVAKRAAKDTGKAVIVDVANKQKVTQMDSNTEKLHNNRDLT